MSTACSLTHFFSFGFSQFVVVVVVVVVDSPSVFTDPFSSFPGPFFTLTG
jgi:high-affinity nickel permease